MGLLLILLAIIGFLSFLISGSSAFDSPTLDMFSVFTHQENPIYFKNDYLVQGFSHQNPRYPFFTFINFTKNLLDQHWYSAFFSLKILISLSLPVLWFTALKSWSEKLTGPLSNSHQFVLALAVALVVIDPLPAAYSIKSLFSVAWWPPFSTSASPQNLALALALFAFSFYKPLHWRTLPLLLLIPLSALMHPAIALMITSFHCGILLCSTKQTKPKWLEILIFFIPCVATCFLVAQIFASPTQISAQDFIHIYSQLGHSSHYDPLHFGEFAGRSWKVIFTLILALLFLGSYYHRKQQSSPWSRVSLFFALFYFSSLLLQYLAVHTLLQKNLAALGSARFLMMGYWMLVLVIGLPLAQKFNIQLPQLNKKQGGGALILILIISVWVSFPHYKKSLHKHTLAKIAHSPLLGWIQKNTHVDDVFIVPFGDLTSDVPRATLRAIVAGAGFPFTEAQFKNYEERESLIYGNFQERTRKDWSWIGAAMAHHYNHLTPQKVNIIHKKFTSHYLILESRHSHIQSFGSPVFSTSKYSIFSLPLAL